MRVPPTFPEGSEALHSLVTWDNILENTGQNMMDARGAVGRRGPFVENK